MPTGDSAMDGASGIRRRCDSHVMSEMIVVPR